jgi:hypothetical protein
MALVLKSQLGSESRKEKGWAWAEELLPVLAFVPP